MHTYLIPTGGSAGCGVPHEVSFLDRLIDYSRVTFGSSGDRVELLGLLGLRHTGYYDQGMCDIRKTIVFVESSKGFVV